MFELWPKISIPEKEFLTKHNLTAENINSIRDQVIKRDGNKCSGCQISDSERKINVHVAEENEEIPLKSKFVCLCLECHYIEHIDKAIEKDYVKLVNSSFNQAQLVNVCRSKDLARHIANGNIEVLKKEPAAYLEDLRAGLLGKNRIKVVFSPKNYKWD